MQIRELACELNRVAVDFEVGRLQEERKRRLSRKKVPARRIFNKKSIYDKHGGAYAFHVGGRTELQFNIGEDNGAIRHGVAFSLQSSKAFPSIELLRLLRPKIKRFNDYICSHAEDLAGFCMWYWTPEEKRSEDYPVAPIPDKLIEPDYFIMLGRKVPPADLNAQHVREILADFDRLLPLYAYVESVRCFSESPTEMNFKPGCPNFVVSTTATLLEGTVDVALRHQKLQKELYKHLCREAGRENVELEHSLAFGVRVDAVVRQGGTYVFYELKVALTVQACVRAALGQLIEYAYWPSAERASKLVIVGEAELSSEDREYLCFLRRQFGLPLWYRRLSHEVLEEES